MKLLNFVFLCASMMFCVVTVDAQIITEFPLEKEKFVDGVEKYLKSTKREDCEIVGKSFKEAVEGGTISDAQFKLIQDMSNKMLKRKLRAFPYFESYLATILNFYEFNQKEIDFLDQWHTVLNQVMEAQRKGDNKKFENFMNFSRYLFIDNSLYFTKAKVWQINNSKYELGYEDNEPLLVFQKARIIGYTNGDTVLVKNTSGTYYPFQTKWVGKGGKTDWRRAGLDSNAVYCKLGKYTIDMSKQSFIIDTVQFYFVEFFPQPITGMYEDKLVVNNLQSSTSYPRFKSSGLRHEIPRIVEDISYKGGFNLFGSKIYGSGSDDEKAILTFYNKEGSKILKAQSKKITFRKPIELTADQAEIELYFGEDSIYHPGLNLSYKIKKREVRLLRGEQGISRSKFYDSFHKQEIEADLLVWNLDESKIDMKMIEGAGQKPAVLQSENYFRPGIVQKYQGVVDYDPLSIMKMYYERNATREIHADDLALAMNRNLSENQIRPLLYRLMEDGFIHYNEARSLVTVKDKTINYVMANAKKIDFDNIRIEALSTKINGTIDLETFDIDLNGVKMIPISDSSYVYAFPDKKLTTIKKNRDMEFSGLLFGGRMDLYGEGYYFNYEAFNVDLTKVDSMKINIPDGDRLDQAGKPILRPIKSQIENMKGLLEINAAANKSGRVRLPQFPKLTSAENAFVYYNKRRTLGGVYHREKFYFQLEPFKMDSLYAFSTSLLQYDGTLVSAGIFPDFKETIKLQPDLSLGFHTETPTSGYSAYGGKGKFTSKLQLDNTGLRGQGKVDYLTSVSNSSDIIFFPDSMISNAEDFNIAKSLAGIGYPQASSKNNYIKWEPYKDQMRIKMKDIPFDMYENQTVLQGNLLLTDRGLYGDGTLDWAEAALSSQQFEFMADNLEADTASLKIKSIDGDKVTFNTPNVHAKVDFKQRKGEFASNTKELDTEFAYNQYKTAINNFDWDMDAKILDFSVPTGSVGAFFISTHPDQGNLRFLGKRAVYDLTTSILEVEHVPEIIVADSRVIPAEGKVTIEPLAKMKTLENATIKSDTINEYHTIEKVTINISAKDKLSGKGEYTYKSRNQTDQIIALKEIGVEKEVVGEKKDAITYKRIYAKGSIFDDQNFKLFPKFDYQGNVKLSAHKEYLNFDGYAKMEFNDPKLESLWFKMNSDVDPQNLVIHYDQPKSIEGLPLIAGINVSTRDSTGMYTTFMNTKNTRSDETIFKTSGMITYDPGRKVFSFGNEAKINNESKQGNVMIYDEMKGTVSAEGTIDLGLSLGAVDVLTAGKIKNDLRKNTYEFDVTLGLNIEINKELNEKFGLYMYEDNFDMPDIDYSADKMLAQIAEITDDKRETKVFEEIATSGIFTKPKEIFHNIVLTDVKLIYDPVEQTYRSKGSIGLMFIGEKSIHRKVEGYIELGYRRSSDYFNIYFKTSLNDWFFIAYKSNSMQIVSSYDDFNQLMMDLDPDKRRIKRDDGKYYLYSYGSISKMKGFVARMQITN